MKTILAVCLNRSDLDTALYPIRGCYTLYAFTGRDKLRQLLAMDRLDQYDLIIVTTFDFRLPYTTPSLVRRFREKSTTPVLVISHLQETQERATEAGATQVVEDMSVAQVYIKRLLNLD